MAEAVFEGEYPKDGENASVGRKARVKVINAFDTEHWDFHEMTGGDVGIDLTFELIENNEFHNYRIDCQIKGRSCVERIKSGSLTLPMEAKTLNYAINAPFCFMLLLYEEESANIYYLPIQEYFLNHPDEKEKLKTQKTLNIHISANNTICPENEGVLIEYAKARY